MILFQRMHLLIMKHFLKQQEMIHHLNLSVLMRYIISIEYKMMIRVLQEYVLKILVLEDLK